MFGLIVRIDTETDSAGKLASILSDGLSEIDGCISYEVFSDCSRKDRLWIVEQWVSEPAHAAALNSPLAARAMSEGRPLIRAIERIATIGEGDHLASA